MEQKILLITGGTGYIGSHAVVAFEQAGYKTVTIDNLSNSSRKSLNGIQKILGYTPDFYECDICDQTELRNIFQKYSFDGVIHFAAKKFVIESLSHPLEYFQNNVAGTLSLLTLMSHYNVQKFVFSSTAGVYDSDNLFPPFSEEDATRPIHPYAASKRIIEEVLQQLAITNSMSSIALRYFNVIGAHPSGCIGDDYFGEETNVAGYLYRTALGMQESFVCYGNTFDTPDGTAIRDYIDVNDLIMGHVQAFQYLSTSDAPHLFEILNLGNGVGVSVQELHKQAQSIIEKMIPWNILPARTGDVGKSIAKIQKAYQILGWEGHFQYVESLKNGWKFILNSQP